jgi:hypothetical protein
MFPRVEQDQEHQTQSIASRITTDTLAIAPIHGDNGHMHLNLGN